jgi:hypothetical protein
VKQSNISFVEAEKGIDLNIDRTKPQLFFEQSEELKE